MRIESVDVFKGLLILLVVLGHQPLPEVPLNFIYSFHMGAFFLLYGVLIKGDRKAFSFVEFCSTKSKQLIYPYLIASIWTLAFFIFSIVAKGQELTGHLLLTKAIKFAYGSAYNGWLEPNGPLWFLLAYFVFVVVVELLRLIETRMLVAPLVAVLTLLIIAFKVDYLPFTAHAALLALPFFYLGKKLKPLLLKRKTNFESSLHAFLFAMLAVGVFVLFSGRVDISSNTIPFYPSFIVVPILMTLSIFNLAKLICLNSYLSRYFQFLGRNTLVILCYHIPLIVASSFIISSVLGMSYEVYRSNLYVVALHVFIYPILLAFCVQNTVLRKVLGVN